MEPGSWAQFDLHGIYMSTLKIPQRSFIYAHANMNFFKNFFLRAEFIKETYLKFAATSRAMIGTFLSVGLGKFLSFETEPLHTNFPCF
jgi:hypothetical protein